MQTNNPTSHPIHSRLPLTQAEITMYAQHGAEWRNLRREERVLRYQEAIQAGTYATPGDDIGDAMIRHTAAPAHADADLIAQDYEAEHTPMTREEWTELERRRLWEKRWQEEVTFAPDDTQPLEPRQEVDALDKVAIRAHTQSREEMVERGHAYSAEVTEQVRRERLCASIGAFITITAIILALTLASVIWRGYL